MKHSILKEVEQIKETENTKGIKFPKTSYIFVENYGRTIHKEMQKLTELSGKKGWFVFQAVKHQGVYQEFTVELSKHAMLGKEFEGCILIEVSWQVEKNELRQMLEYLKEQENKINFFFSVKEEKIAKELKAEMDRYFFTRMLEGEVYSQEEQLRILMEELEKYELYVEESVKQEVLKLLAGLSWQTTDLVEHTLQNVARKLAYEKMLEDSSDGLLEEDIKKALEEVNPYSQKNRIGFVLE